MWPGNTTDVTACPRSQEGLGGAFHRSDLHCCHRDDQRRLPSPIWRGRISPPSSAPGMRKREGDQRNFSLGPGRYREVYHEGSLPRTPSPLKVKKCSLMTAVTSYVSMTTARKDAADRQGYPRALQERSRATLNPSLEQGDRNT